MHALPYVVTGLMGSFAGTLLVVFLLVLLAIPCIAYVIGRGIGFFVRTSYAVYAIVPSILLIGAYHDVIGMGEWSFLRIYGTYHGYSYGYICNFICVIATCYGMIEESRINFFDSLQKKRFPSDRAYRSYASRGGMIVVFCVMSLALTAAFLHFHVFGIMAEAFSAGITAIGSAVEDAIGDTIIFDALEHAYWFVVDVCFLVYDWIKYDLFS